MKVVKNQDKQGRTPNSEGGLKKRPFATGTPFKKTPKSQAKLMKRGPLSKTASSSEGGASQTNGKHQSETHSKRELVMSSIESDLVSKIEKELFKKVAQGKTKKRKSLPGEHSEGPTPSSLKVAKKRASSSEGRGWYSSGDDWLETPIEGKEIKSILPTKTMVIVEDSPTDNTPADESSQVGGQNPTRTGIQMFPGTSDLNLSEGAAVKGKKTKKKHRKEAEMMSKLQEGDASALDKLSYFEDKVKELTECATLSSSKRRLLNRYRKCVAVGQKFKAGDLSFLGKKSPEGSGTTLNKNADGNGAEGGVKKEGGEATTLNKNADGNGAKGGVKKEGGEATTAGKKTRFVLFVGNLPYAVDQHRIIEHFRKAGRIASVRIPTDKETNKCRGFAFVELTTKEAYEKALSMHHTFIEGRRINVLYSNQQQEGAVPAKKGTKAKNFKLAAMRKEGLLAGSVKESQKRSARRAKKNKAAAAVPNDN